MGITYFLVAFLVVQFVNADICSEDEKPKVISLLDDHYLLKTVSEHHGNAPEVISFRDGEIFFIYNQSSFVVREDKRIDSLKYKIFAENKKYYIDPTGTVVINENGKVTLNYHLSTKVVKIVTDIGYTVSYMGIDLDKNRVFLFSHLGSEIGTLKTELHVFDMEGLDVSGGIASADHIADVGDNIVAVSVDKISGNIALCERVNDTFWRFKTVEKINKSPCRSKETAAWYNRAALESAIQFAGTEILRLYEDAIGITLMSDAPSLDVRMGGNNDKAPYVEVSNMLKRQLAFVTQNSKTLHKKITSLKDKLNKKVSEQRSQVKKDTLVVVRPAEINSQMEYVCAQKKDFMIHFSSAEENKADLENLYDILNATGKDLSDISEISHVLQGIKPE